MASGADTFTADYGTENQKLGALCIPPCVVIYLLLNGCLILLHCRCLRACFNRASLPFVFFLIPSFAFAFFTYLVLLFQSCKPWTVGVRVRGNR